MGLLESMLGSALGGGNAEQGGLAGALGGLISQHGGLEGLIARFNQAGLGELVSSWVGKGQNLPISADQLSSVLGNDALAGIAAKLGIDPAQAAGSISAMLPGLIDQLTPNGTTEGAGGVDLMGVLGGLLQKR
jgi:uncharacterized protein YidB (DUF937 family)